jgi:hypothetical protein
MASRTGSSNAVSYARSALRFSLLILLPLLFINIIDWKPRDWTEGYRPLRWDADDGDSTLKKERRG